MVRHSQRDVPCLLRGCLRPRINEEGTLRVRLEPSSKKRKVWGFSGGVTGTEPSVVQPLSEPDTSAFPKAWVQEKPVLPLAWEPVWTRPPLFWEEAREEWAASEAWEPEEFASIRPVVPPTPQHVDEYRRIPKMPVCLPIPDANHPWRTTVSKSPQSDL